MTKNAIHNFNLSIKNSADIKSSEHLTEAILKELAKVSKEMSQQKDIEQVWQEQQTLNTTAIVNNSGTSIGEGATNTTAEKSEKQIAVSNTSSVAEGIITNFTVSTGGGTNGTPELIGTTSSVSETRTSTSSASVGEGVADTIGGMTMSSPASANTTSPISGAEDNASNLSDSIMAQTYASVAAQQTLTVPSILQANSGEPTIEAVKAEIKKKLAVAIIANDSVAIGYWASISKAFDEGATVQAFDGQPNNMLFTEMYVMLKKSNSVIQSQNFNWESVRKKMIGSIDSNILNGKISKGSKSRWELIKKQLNDDSINVANLFEQYDELFLLLKEVEGLDSLPNTITITTKTKIYPNLSADNLYANIGKDAVYVFLKEINNEEVQGSAVNKGAVKIKNTEATSFIVGESLEFFLDENFIKQNIFQKQNINWVVYNSKKKNDKGTIFINEGTSFSYNFDTAGTYKVEAYGNKPGANTKKNVRLSAFVELKIVVQEIVITSSGITKDGLTRASTKEQLFKVSLKNPEIKTLNPLKLYYQVESKTANKITVISEEQELDSTGIVKFSMLNLGEYCIKICSKDQYNLSKEHSINVIKNFVSSIDKVKDNIENDVYLYNKTNRNAIFKTKTFKIDPATPQEKENVKWLVYDKKGNLYVPDGLKIQIENNDAEKPYLFKGESFIFPIPKKEGEFTVEAYSNIKQGFKSKSARKIEVKHPQVIEAFWTYNDGNKKKTSGFTGEINHIKANIPGYVNQPVRIKFFLNDSKVANYYNDTKTNANGEINKILKFDANLQKHFGIKNGKTAKIRFELEGIQNGNEPYLFKQNTNVYNEAILNVTTGVKITDAYFMYDGNRVNPFIQVPYGAKVTGVVKTLNMVGKEVKLKIYKDVHHAKHIAKAIVDAEGVATINFALDKKWKEITPLLGLTDMFYIGMEGVESKISLKNGMNAVVGNVVKRAQGKKEIIFPLLDKPTNDTNSKWGKNYNWTDDDGHNQATFDSYRDHRKRKHGGRDLYTEKGAKVIAIADGKVLESAKFYSGTDQVTILHKLKDGRKFIARYGELNPKSIKVKKNDIIKQGQHIGDTGKLIGVTVITGQDIYMLHFEIFSTEKGENLNSPLTNKLNGSPFLRRKDLIDSFDILLEGYKNTFDASRETKSQGTRMDVGKMKLSEKAKKFIKDWEDFKPNLYNDDSNKHHCTIGYGHLVHKGPCNGSESQEFKNGIDEKRATELFNQRLLEFEKAVKRDIYVHLYQNEYDALVSLLYNTGKDFLNVGGVNDGVTKIKKNINSKDYEGGADEMADVTNGGLKGLVARRKAEIKMFKYNIYDSSH